MRYGSKVHIWIYSNIYTSINVAVKGKYETKQIKSHNKQNITELNNESEDL